MVSDSQRSGGISETVAELTKRCPHCDGEYEAALLFCPRDGGALRAPAVGDDLTGQIVADRYRVLRRLGQGGMGQVYLAEHTRMGRFCALKVMSPALVADTDAVARFDREAYNASRITHPGVAAVYDFGEASDGIVYLAMEYVDGEPLTAVLLRDEVLPIERALRIARQIAEALSAAHELGIVHRDLKPENIMLGRNRDGSDCVKVVDFGISKGVHGTSQKLTITGLIVGTPAYMSPEQLAGDPVDGRSDIYSLGLVLFHMVAGTLPFAGGQEGVLARLIAAPRSLADMKPDREWPASLQSVLDRALAPVLRDRYPTADAMALDIGRLLDGSNTALSNGITPKAAWRRPRTRTMVVGGALIAAGSVAAMFGLSTRDALQGVAGSSVPTTPQVESLASLEGAEDRAPISSEKSVGPGSPGTSARPTGTVAELDSLQVWTSPTTGTEETARRVIARFPELLPRLATGNDSVAAHYYAAGAYIMLGDASSACATLQRIKVRAATHPYLANAVASYLADPTLNCR